MVDLKKQKLNVFARRHDEANSVAEREIAPLGSGTGFLSGKAPLVPLGNGRHTHLIHCDPGPGKFLGSPSKIFITQSKKITPSDVLEGAILLIVIWDTQFIYLSAAGKPGGLRTP